MVDEPRLVAAHCRIDDDVVIDGEQECVMPFARGVGVSRVRLRRREALARILSFVILGLVLLGVSWIYTRFKDEIRRFI